jgi:hypothetical protein
MYVSVQCSAVQCSAVQCSAVQCSAVQCSIVQCTAVYCSVLHTVHRLNFTVTSVASGFCLSNLFVQCIICSAVQYSEVQCSAAHGDSVGMCICSGYFSVLLMLPASTECTALLFTSLNYAALHCSALHCKRLLTMRKLVNNLRRWLRGRGHRRMYPILGQSPRYLVLGNGPVLGLLPPVHLLVDMLDIFRILWL